MEAIYTGRSHRRGLCRAAVHVHRDGDNVFPSWAGLKYGFESWRAQCPATSGVCRPMRLRNTLRCTSCRTVFRRIVAANGAPYFF